MIETRSTLRPKNADADIYAQRLSDEIAALINEGVAPDRVSKPAAAMASRIFWYS